MDEDSDDIARATDQETVMKLAADKATVQQSAQLLNATFDESINRPQDATQDTMNKQEAEAIAANQHGAEKQEAVRLSDDCKHQADRPVRE